MIKMSAGTAHVLGFKKLAIDALPTTAYLMSGEKCYNDCGFCPQARNASSRADLLSRVTWSEGTVENISCGIGTAFRQGKMKRACLQVVTGHQVLSQVEETVKKIKAHSDIPICVSAKVDSVAEVKALAETGVDRIGLALDAACERVFKETKTGSWQRTLDLIREAAQALPGRISTHLIVGLGETEEEMVHMLQKMWQMQVTVGLFAFTPVPGTRLSGQKPPALDAYRRMQAANYLLEQGLLDVNQCLFEKGQLIDFGLTREQLAEYLETGKAFQTSGCPDCNRPYYNEKPGGVMYNFPRPLEKIEIQEAIDQVTHSLKIRGQRNG